MLQNLLKSVFGDRNSRLLKNIGKRVQQINALEGEMQALSDAQLTAQTEKLRARIAAGESKNMILPSAFAVVREAAVRTLGLRHFDVQLIGGMVLDSGKIAEMKTGEGKTLVATLPAYLNALTGESVHIVTVNDYLAKRDAEWMGKIFEFLGLSVGVIISGQDPEEKRAAYKKDIVYGTNNEFGFDYLRDNMAFTAADRLQNGLGFAVVDEVDSILIDEARTPLIISGPAEESTGVYARVNKIAPKLKRQASPDGEGDFSVDEKTRQVYLTEQGHEMAERLLSDADLLPEGGSLYDIGNIGLLHHLNAALRAHHLYQKDVAYIVRDREIIIIDEFTGRMMAGRRWSDGLHQAVEAKEGVPINQENQTLASITFQNYFRLYKNLAGMTGTADTESTEFMQIYQLEVIVIPTNREMVRRDLPDLVYRTAAEKYNAIIDGIMDCRTRQQPVLVGTASIESSEKLSILLKQKKIPHKVLNAKHHASEAQIIAEAGRPGVVTIATNMAGRGTDIVLGGNLELELKNVNDADAAQKIRKQWQTRYDAVISGGGLHVLGTERNESRRVDNQLRGRCGRQGDPGSSQYYLSLEDSLMRIFGSSRISGLMQKLGMQDGEAIEHPWVSRAIANAQMKVEGHNFDARKQLLEYDDVANEQRKVIYEQRNRLMETDDIADDIIATRKEVVSEIIDRYIIPNSLPEQWEIKSLTADLATTFGLDLPIEKWLSDDEELFEDTLRLKIAEQIEASFADKEKQVGSDTMRNVEKTVLLQVLDEQWKEHLASMDQLRQGIHLRGYAQKNPKQEYKRESYEMFSAMLAQVKIAAVAMLAKLRIPTDAEVAQMQRARREQEMQMNHPAAADPTAATRAADTPAITADQPFVRKTKKIGRNDKCPCGSGKKYKHCHGRV